MSRIGRFDWCVRSYVLGSLHPLKDHVPAVNPIQLLDGEGMNAMPHHDRRIRRRSNFEHTACGQHLQKGLCPGATLGRDELLHLLPSLLASEPLL